MSLKLFISLKQKLLPNYIHVHILYTVTPNNKKIKIRQLFFLIWLAMKKEMGTGEKLPAGITNTSLMTSGKTKRLIIYKFTTQKMHVHGFSKFSVHVGRILHVF